MLGLRVRVEGFRVLELGLGVLGCRVRGLEF